ncbi:acyltransferase [Aquabacterium lacunae]|uniref:Acyltransferase n=1 Tax=Aquabacterium lacunae TaxID=2528630 RepID=A0A4V2JFR8_9BURK|nr:acyltransferase [Aquabacterium lacunae]TBO32416.1 acyltransferase [Aquabacterium lacunae]
MNEARSGQIRPLTGLRFIAALMVFGSHLAWVGVGPMGQGVIDQGFFGVSFFFMLSGFVLMHSYAEPLRQGHTSPWVYVGLRVARLWPLHVFMALPYLFLAARRGDLDPVAALSNLLLLQSWVPDSTVYFSLNGPTWSLSNEAFFYLAFLWLVHWPDRLRHVLTLALLTVVLTGAVCMHFWFSDAKVAGAYTLAHWLFYVFPAFRLLEFLVGMWLHDLWRQGWLNWRMPAWAAFVLLGACMLFGQQVPEPFRYSLFYLPAAVCLLVAHLGQVRTRWHAFLSSDVLQALGKASFAFYVVHMAVVRQVIKAFPWVESTAWIEVPLLLVLCCMVAWLVHRGVERPVEQAARRWLTARPPILGSAPSRAHPQAPKLG